MAKKITIIVFSILIVVSIILVNSLFVEEYTEDDIFGTSFSTFFKYYLTFSSYYLKLIGFII